MHFSRRILNNRCRIQTRFALIRCLCPCLCHRIDSGFRNTSEAFARTSHICVTLSSNGIPVGTAPSVRSSAKVVGMVLRTMLLEPSTSHFSGGRHPCFCEGSGGIRRDRKSVV